MKSVKLLSVWGTLACAWISATVADAGPPRVLPPVAKRFAAHDATETPSFQKHLVPLLGKLGCNGRACHGSFQGRGGFRLSLFGYDFKMDHEGLSERLDTEDPAESYCLQKPTLQTDHEGGKRMEIGSWEYNLFLNWIKGGAKGVEGEPLKLAALEVTPAEIQFRTKDQKKQLKAVAVWEDGTREDVTCLCRFQSNDDSICNVTPAGLVSAGDLGDSHVVVFYDMAVIPVPVIRPVSDQIGKNYPQVATSTKIDELVVQKLAKLGIIPSERSDDAEFLRRVHLDLTGTLPSADDVRKFLADKSPDKRARKVDELMTTPAYAAWWTTRLCDWTGCAAQQLNNIGYGRQGNASDDWYQWIYKRIATNVPYDKLVEGIVLAQGRREDESYFDYCERMSKYYQSDDPSTAFADCDGLIYFWGRRNFQSTEDRAIGFAYTFMGTRIQCAQCHKHPFDIWTKSDFEQFEKFFAAVRFDRGTGKEAREILEKLEVGKLRGNEQRRKLGELLKEGQTVPFPDIAITGNRGGNRKGKSKAGEKDTGSMARLLGEQIVDLGEIKDPRTALMDWLRNSPTRLFAKALVNRVWANYFNRGIVEPTDDLSLANPPSNQALLDYLVEGFIQHGYDMQWLHREICLSDTYQRTWRPNETNAGDERNFSRAVPRRLPAEAAYDALVMATASSQEAQQFEEDLKERAVSIASPPRNNRASGPDYALRIFGRSVRESNCDCDRSAEASLLQTVYVRNDADVLGMIDRRDGWVAEVMKSIQPESNSSDDRRLEAARQRVEQLEKQVAKAANKKQREKLEAQLQAAGKRLAELKPTKPSVKQAPPMEDPAAIVEEAYLRTVSRYPTGEEVKIASAFVTEASNPSQGVRDLLWALMNTKEFMVNH